jgi:hypothetical protein
MGYRAYSGPAGSEPMSYLDKERMLFKEFGSLDEAIAWADHVKHSGRVALLIEGDDGTRLDRSDIAKALHRIFQRARSPSQGRLTSSGQRIPVSASHAARSASPSQRAAKNCQRRNP